MNASSDPQLLRDYSERRSEAAFAELVRRHIDLVHSAAFRMTGDSHLAKDVSQGVFVALAKDAGKLTNHPVLAGWLHRTARNLAAKSVRTDVRRRAREKEAAAINAHSETDVSWEEIAPHLDSALGALSERDRDAVLLRYFENKAAHEMAAILGITAEAAQKRVSRAVEKLRENFAKRGIPAGAAGLAGVISANAVQSAPAGLATTTSAGVLAGTAVSSSITAAKTLFMTAHRKALIAATVAVVIGAGIYFAIKAANSREQALTSQELPAPRKTKNPRLPLSDSPGGKKARTRTKNPSREQEDIAKIPWPKVVLDFPHLPLGPGQEARVSSDRYEITRRRSTDPEVLRQGGSGGGMIETELRDTKSSWSTIFTEQSVGGRLLEDHQGRPQIESWGRGGGGYWTRSLYRYISGEYQRVRTDEFQERTNPDLQSHPTTNPPFAPHGEDDETGKLLHFVETRLPSP